MIKIIIKIFYLNIILVLCTSCAIKMPKKLLVHENQAKEIDSLFPFINHPGSNNFEIADFVLMTRRKATFLRDVSIENGKIIGQVNSKRDKSKRFLIRFISPKAYIRAVENVDNSIIEQNTDTLYITEEDSLTVSDKKSESINNKDYIRFSLDEIEAIQHVDNLKRGRNNKLIYLKDPTAYRSRKIAERVFFGIGVLVPPLLYVWLINRPGPHW